MGSLAYRFRIRNAANDADELVFTSLRDGDLPYIAAPPSGDGCTLDPVTGETTVGAYRVQVIDAVDTVTVQPSTLLVSEGFEYANQAAMEAADWTLADTLSDGSITVGATDEVYGGGRSLKMATTGTGGLAGGGGLSASKVYGAGDGIAPSTLYRVTVRGWMSFRPLYDVNTWLIVNGVRASITSQGMWQSVSMLIASTVASELAVSLVRQHAFTTITTNIWWDALTIESLDEDTETVEGRVVTSYLTDGNARQQLLSRKAFVDDSENDGASWSVLTPAYVNSIRLPKATTFDFTVGETRRIEQSQRVFDKISNPVTHPDLIGILDRTCCILGGPIVGNFGPYTDRNRPVYRVEKIIAGNLVRLEWVSGPAHSVYAEFNPPLRDSVSVFLNAAAREYVAAESATSLGAGIQIAACPGLICRLYDKDTGEWVADHVAGANRVQIAGTDTDWVVVRKDGAVYVSWSGALPSVGDRFRFAMFPARVGPRNPIHFSGHPMDLLKYWYDLSGEDYDEVSRLAVRSALGNNLVVNYRVFEGSTLKEAAEKYVFAPFGVAVRPNTAGLIEFFRTRDRSSVAPTDTITTNDLTSDEGVVWSLDEESAAVKVVFESKAFSLTAERSDSTPLDAIAAANVRTEVVPDEEVTVFGDREITFSIPGHIVGLVPGTTENPGTLDRWVTALAAPLFDWQGRGAVTTEISVRRGVTTAKVGDEVVLDLAHMPTASAAQTPTSQRGTVPIIAQILQRTERPNGPALRLQHRGTAASLGVVPEFTIAASDVAPKKAAELTITNESELVVAAAKVAIEWAVASSEPVAGQVLRIWRPSVDATVFDTTLVDAGSRIWVRMRAERPGSAPGAWSDWQDVNLMDLVPPSDLVVTVNGITAEMTWTVGETNEPVEILLRKEDVDLFDSIILLPAGSDRYTLILPDAEADYVSGVRHRESPPFNGVSATVTDETSAGAAEVLLSPINPSAFSDGRGTFGLEVTGTVFPSGTAFWVAVETAVGSGVAGTYEAAGATPAISVGRTRFTNPSVAPNDGKRRFLKARHERNGAESDFTEPVSIFPWLVITPEDPEPEIEPFPGLTETPIPIVLLGATLPRHFWAIPAERTVIGVSEKFPLGQFKSARVVAVVTSTSLPDGAVVAVEFENPAVDDDWHPLAEDDGPELAIDPTSLTDLLGKAVDSGYVTIRDEAQDDVRLRAVLDGCDGDVAKKVAFTRIELQPLAQDVANAPPPETAPPSPFDPGSCDTPGDMDDLSYANQAAAEAAGWAFT